MKQENQAITDSLEKPQRRSLLNRLWALLALLACIELSWLTGSIFKSRKTRNLEKDRGQFVDGGRVEALRPGDVKAIPEGMLYLSCLENGSFIALSRTCTHLGCALSWDVNDKKFVCPCHGSTFNQEGVVLTAPAIRPLDFSPVRIENGLVRIDISSPLKREKFDPAQVTKA